MRKARLVALQIVFLTNGSGNLIVGLSSSLVPKFIINHPKVWEVTIPLYCNKFSLNYSFRMS